MAFNGFHKETIQFFKDLSDNNDKTWFDANRAGYDDHLIAPAKTFIAAMGDRLREIAPEVVAQPKVNGSLMRIYRDTRFSEDKTPYKTHQGIIFWEGPHKKMENPSFYFHFDTENLLLGHGIYAFSKPVLATYREYVATPRHGAALAEIFASFEAKGLDINGKTYKKTPRGYDADYEFADLLLYSGITVGREQPIPDVFFSGTLVDHCFDFYQEILPLHRWMVDMVKQVEA